MGTACVMCFVLCIRNRDTLYKHERNSYYYTGAVKITPAHDYNDYDVGKRHNLPFVEMIDETGLITDVCEQFKVGMYNT